MHIAVWKKVVFSLCALFATGWVLYLAYIVFSGHFIYTFTDIALLCFAVYAPLFLGILFLSRCEKQALQKYGSLPCISVWHFTACFYMASCSAIII